MNILLIGVDDVGTYGLEHVTTPHLTAFKNASVSFPRFYATSSVCSPSRIGMWTGQHARRFDIGMVTDVGSPIGLPTGTPTIASLLEGVGYRTAHVGKWHVSIGDVEEVPGEFGYDEWSAMAGSNLNVAGGNYTNWARIDGSLAEGAGTSTETSYATHAQAEAAVEWWEQTAGKKFLSVNFNAAHAPFHAPPVQYLPPGYEVVNNNRGKYEAALVALDGRIGFMLENMRLTGALIVFWSDNGTPVQAIAPGQDPLKVKQSMYGGGIQTPFWVKRPGVPPSQSRRVVSGVDLYATLADLLFTDVPYPADSLSFADVLGGKRTTPKRTWAYSERFDPNGDADVFQNRQRMVARDDQMKLIVEEFDDGETVVEKLYELPDETTLIDDRVVQAELLALMDSI